MNLKTSSMNTTAFVLAFLMAGCISSFQLPANAAGPVLLTVGSTNGKVGMDVVVAVSISADSGLAATSLLLMYDHAKLTWKSSVAGPAAAAGSSEIYEMYEVSGDFTTINDTFICSDGITASGEMIIITFTINPGWTGATPVVLTVMDFFDAELNEISYSISNGTVTLSSNNVSITPKAGSATIINHDKYIYGLVPDITKTLFESNFIQLSDNGRLQYTPNTESFGTGTIIELIDNTTQLVKETYTVIIFGDVNGDGNIDSIDAGTIVDYENYISTWDPTADAAYIKAGDLNGDGTIDSIDAGIAVDAENYMVTIDQSTGLAS